MDEVDKIVDEYITTHNRKFDFCFFNCEFKIEFDNNFTTNIEINYWYSIEIINMKSYLLCCIDCFKSRGYKFYKINQTTVKTNSDRCNMTYEHFICQPMCAVERQKTQS